MSKISKQETMIIRDNMLLPNVITCAECGYCFHLVAVLGRYDEQDDSKYYIYQEQCPEKCPSCNKNLIYKSK